MVQSPPVLNPETGERERLFLGTYPTYQEAAAQLEPYKLEHITERYNYSLQKIYEIVTATRSYQKLSKSQRDSYAAAWSNWMKALHGQKARVLRTADYQDVLDDIIDAGRSVSFASKARGLMVKLCAYMNANDIIPKNYAQLTVIESDEEAKDREIFTDEEIGLFFAHKADREAKFILCLIFIGLRPNELAKIKRDDQVHLRDGYFVNGSKTKAGRERKMPIMQIIMPIFKEMWLATQPGDYLFRSPDGRQLDTHNWRTREFYPYLASLGIQPDPSQRNEAGERLYPDKPKYTPYTCRHTFASLSDRTHVKKEILQLAIGHKLGSDITDDVYIHKQVGEIVQEFGKLNAYAQEKWG